MVGSFNWMAVLSLILVPALTMRLFAEENRLGTIEPADDRAGARLGNCIR